MLSLTHLSNEILSQIVHFLDYQSATRLACVSMFWQEIADKEQHWENRFYRDLSRQCRSDILRCDPRTDWKTKYRMLKNPSFPHENYSRAPALPYSPKNKAIERFYMPRSRKDQVDLESRDLRLVRGGLTVRLRFYPGLWCRARRHGNTMHHDFQLLLRGYVLGGGGPELCGW